MEYDFSQKIIRQYSLIDCETSKKILDAIRHDAELEISALPPNVTLEKIEGLRSLYRETFEEFDNEPLIPRNKIFYKMIQKRFPKFNWEVRDEKIKFNYVRIGKLEPSLASLLLSDIQTDDKPAIYFKYDMLEEVNPNIVKALDTLFAQIEVIYPNQNNMLEIINWIYRGLSGEKLHIFALACPDYSVQPTGNPLCPFKHTFDELGSGIGLIAARVLDALPFILKTLNTLGIQVEATLAMADYEVLSVGTLHRLNLSSEKFLDQLRSSLAAFQVKLPLINSVMFSELCEGLDNWKIIYVKYSQQFQQKNFGSVTLSDKQILEKVKTRKQLYINWHGEKESLSDYVPIFLAQAAEYAVVGDVVSKQFKNCLILGADHTVFSDFYCVKNYLPTLYLQRFYC